VLEFLPKKIMMKKKMIPPISTKQKQPPLTPKPPNKKSKHLDFLYHQ
jgi:hypothetical protein